MSCPYLLMKTKITFFYEITIFFENILNNNCY